MSLASWIRHRRASDVPLARLLAVELPRKLARKATAAYRDARNTRLVAARDAVYRERVRGALTAADEMPYCLVAVPEILHFVIPCLTLATRHVPVVLVLNGVRDWEERILFERFPALPVVRLDPLRGSKLSHGVVMEILLRHAERDFGLLDPDLYVFDPGVFERMRLSAGELAVGAFGFTNRVTGLVFPTTHLLALDVGAVRSLMSEHGIGPGICRRPPPELVAPLRSLGLGEGNFPKDYLPYYDPMNLIFAVALHAGKRLRTLDCRDDEATHVGGITYSDRNAWLDYFHLRLLELPFAGPFAARYRELLRLMDDPARLRVRLEALGAGETVSRIDGTVDRISAALNENR
jgi:hypothetical protein